MSIKVNSLINRSIKVSSPIGRKLFVSAPINRKLFVSSEMSVPIFVANIPPTGTLALNSIVESQDPGEVLFDFTTSDSDGTVANIELLRKESVEPEFTEVAEILIPGASGQITDLAVPGGTFEYKLLITDNDGLTAESNVVAGIVIVTLTVTFDVPPDGVIANGAGVPGFESIIKGYSSGTNGEVRQISGIGRTTSLANTDGAFFTLEDDLNLLNVDTTWEVTQKIKVTSISPGNRYMCMVRGSKTTTKIALWPTDVILICQMLDDLRVAFFYRNTSGTLVQLAIFSSAYTVGVETTMEIKKDATNYTFTLGAVSSQIAISSVQAETNNFYTVGAFATIINVHVGENDDIERQ